MLYVREMLYVLFWFFYTLFYRCFISQNSNLAINYLNFTINSGDTDTTTMNYPASKDKNSLKVLGIAFYRNAVWYFDGRVGSIALTNDNITFLLSSGYNYAKGLPAFILYN